MKPVTNWVIADLSIKEGRALVMAALKQMVTMSVCNNRREVASLGPGSADYLSAQFARRYFFSSNAGPGARFSKVPIINGPVKLLWFTCKIEVSIVLHLT